MAPRGWPGIWQCLPPRCKEWGSGGQPSKQGFGEWLEQQLEDSWENTWVLIWTTRRAKKKGKTRGLKEMERQSWDQERQLWTTVFVEFSAAEQEQAGLFKVGSWGRATARAPFFFFCQIQEDWSSPLPIHQRSLQVGRWKGEEEGCRNWEGSQGSFFDTKYQIKGCLISWVC